MSTTDFIGGSAFTKVHAGLHVTDLPDSIALRQKMQSSPETAVSLLKEHFRSAKHDAALRQRVTELFLECVGKLPPKAQRDVLALFDPKSKSLWERMAWAICSLDRASQSTLQKSLPCLREGVSKGYAIAQYWFGKCCEGGFNETVDVPGAIALYEKAAAQGLASAQNELALHICTQPEERVRAFSLWQRASKKGDLYAINNLGYCYQFGEGVKADIAKAVSCYKEAAEKGIALAQNNLGLCLLTGKGVAKDAEAAFELFEKASQQKYAGALNNAGYCLQHGYGTEINAKRAFSYFKKAAELGHIRALRNVRYCLLNGIGVKKDAKQAAVYCPYAEKRDSSLSNPDDLLSEPIGESSSSSSPDLASPTWEEVNRLIEIVQIIAPSTPQSASVFLDDIQEGKQYAPYFHQAIEMLKKKLAQIDPGAYSSLHASQLIFIIQKSFSPVIAKAIASLVQAVQSNDLKSAQSIIEDNVEIIARLRNATFPMPAQAFRGFKSDARRVLEKAAIKETLVDQAIYLHHFDIAKLFLELGVGGSKDENLRWSFRWVLSDARWASIAKMLLQMMSPTDMSSWAFEGAMDHRESINALFDSRINIYEVLRTRSEATATYFKKMTQVAAFVFNGMHTEQFKAMTRSKKLHEQIDQAFRYVQRFLSTKIVAGIAELSTNINSELIRIISQYAAPNAAESDILISQQNDKARVEMRNWCFQTFDAEPPVSVSSPTKDSGGGKSTKGKAPKVNSKEKKDEEPVSKTEKNTPSSSSSSSSSLSHRHGGPAWKEVKELLRIARKVDDSTPKLALEQLDKMQKGRAYRTDIKKRLDDIQKHLDLLKTQTYTKLNAAGLIHRVINSFPYAEVNTNAIATLRAAVRKDDLKAVKTCLAQNVELLAELIEDAKTDATPQERVRQTIQPDYLAETVQAAKGLDQDPAIVATPLEHQVIACKSLNVALLFAEFGVQFQHSRERSLEYVFEYMKTDLRWEAIAKTTLAGLSQDDFDAGTYIEAALKASHRAIDLILDANLEVLEVLGSYKTLSQLVNDQKQVNSLVFNGIPTTHLKKIFKTQKLTRAIDHSHVYVSEYVRGLNNRIAEEAGRIFSVVNSAFQSLLPAILEFAKPNEDDIYSITILSPATRIEMREWCYAKYDADQKAKIAAAEKASPSKSSKAKKDRAGEKSKRKGKS